MIRNDIKNEFFKIDFAPTSMSLCANKSLII